MSRPSPTVLLDSTNNDTGKSEQVLEIECLYIVVYKGNPFNLRSLNKLYDYPGPKYRKTAFSCKTQATKLMKRLNELYDCEDFDIREFGGE